jgi:hypothetical protein
MGTLLHASGGAGVGGLLEHADRGRGVQRSSCAVTIAVKQSTLKRLPDESWYDALIFQAHEHGGDEAAYTAECNYRHYKWCGESDEDAAWLVSVEMKLPKRSVTP